MLWYASKNTCIMQWSLQVKEVPNGDTLAIVGNVASGPPPEKRITLSSLIAPRLVSVQTHS
jgi:hypothetical protein